MKRTSMILTGLSIFLISSSTFADVNVAIKNAQGEKIGTAKLTQKEDSINISLRVSKLSPGKHGIHFHENGKCEGPDFKSAGGHLNPAKKEHGLENTNGSHAGDLPNIDVKKDGTVKAEITSHGATLDEASLLKAGGTALVIHAKSDDQHSNPAGNAGDRIACGVIQK
jgi:Cu-Zn family superoxide dismutase